MAKDGMTLYMNAKGQLDEFEEEDYVSVPKDDMDLVQGYIEKHQADFKAYCESQRKHNAKKN